MEMSKAVVAMLLVLCLMSGDAPLCSAADPNCYDACSTGCVQRNTRLMQRCDRKCQIRCGPDAEVELHLH